MWRCRNSLCKSLQALSSVCGTFPMNFSGLSALVLQTDLDDCFHKQPYEIPSFCFATGNPIVWSVAHMVPSSNQSYHPLWSVAIAHWGAWLFEGWYPILTAFHNSINGVLVWGEPPISSPIRSFSRSTFWIYVVSLLWKLQRDLHALRECETYLHDYRPLCSSLNWAHPRLTKGEFKFCNPNLSKILTKSSKNWKSPLQILRASLCSNRTMFDEHYPIGRIHRLQTNLSIPSSIALKPWHMESECHSLKTIWIDNLSIKKWPHQHLMNPSCCVWMLLIWPSSLEPHFFVYSIRGFRNLVIYCDSWMRTMN